MSKIKCKFDRSYIVFCFMSYGLLDWILRKTYVYFGDVALYDKIPLLFVIGWSLVLCGITYILPGIWKKIFMIISVLFFSILVLVHGAYINVFDKFFSFSDLSLLKEGAGFADTSYIDIRKRIILIVIISCILMIVAIYIVPKEHSRREITIGSGILAIGMVFIIGAHESFPEKQDAAEWDCASNITNVYDDFVDTKRCMILCGMYEYTFRDIWEIINPFDTLQYEKEVEEIDEKLSDLDSEKEINNKTGIFKNKNLILVQLENIDTWMLTKENMPNLYKLKQEGINFENHYSVGFATGKTFNTEFIVNTGYVPQTKGEAPSYIYSKNYYPNSLANLFKEKGYTVNSYHSNNGSIYNRGNVHKVFGYEKYHNFEDMGMEDYTMDSQMLNNFDAMITSDRFFDFLITYSGHGPFSLDNNVCKKHLEEVKQENQDTDKTYLYGLSQAKETDEFVQILIQKLTQSGLLDDTVLVFYTDHYAYSTISKEKELELKGTNDPNLLQNTPFFIWSKDIEPENVEKVTSTIDILPTLANMFELECDYHYFIGNDAFDSKKGYAFFSDFSWYDGEIYYNSQYDGEMTRYIKETVKEVDEKTKISWGILESNYFVTKKMENDESISGLMNM